MATQTTVPFNSSTSFIDSAGKEIVINISVDYAKVVPPVDLTTYNVKDYGAVGDGVADDTVAIRKAIAKAAVYRLTNPKAKVYFPAGTYAVCPQAGDAILSGYFRPIFPLSGGLDFVGDGSTKTFIKGYCKGLTSPLTNFIKTGDSYFKIARFSLFSIVPTVANFAPITFTGFNLDGQAGYTGNFAVGGDVVTGDGWDMTHKCFHIDGPKTVERVDIKDCVAKNWRGEIVYAGGTALTLMNLINSNIAGTNASAVSVSGGFIMDGCIIGVDKDNPKDADRVYNGTENFAINPNQYSEIRNSRIRCDTKTTRGNAIVVSSVPGARVTIEKNDISCSNSGILLSETANSINIKGNNFDNCSVNIICSFLNLYNNGNKGFKDITIDGNTTYGKLLTPQGQPITNLTVSNNIIGGILLSDSCSDKMYNFQVTGNTFLAGSLDIRSVNRGAAPALWSGNIRKGNVLVGDTVGNWINIYNGADTTVWPLTDYVFFNDNAKLKTKIILDTKTNYPVGFTTTLVAAKAGWVLTPDPLSNTLTAETPIPVGNGSLKVRFNANKLWEIV